MRTHAVTLKERARYPFLYSVLRPAWSTQLSLSLTTFCPSRWIPVGWAGWRRRWPGRRWTRGWHSCPIRSSIRWLPCRRWKTDRGPGRGPATGSGVRPGLSRCLQCAQGIQLPVQQAVVAQVDGYQLAQHLGALGIDEVALEANLAGAVVPQAGAHTDFFLAQNDGE